MVGGTQATERRVKTLLGEEVVVKPNAAWGSVSPSKSGPEPPTLFKLEHMIISCGDLRLVGSTRHRKMVQI